MKCNENRTLALLDATVSRKEVHQKVFLVIPPSTLPGGLPPTSLLFRSHAAVSVSGQGPRRGADAVVGAGRVHAMAVLAVGRVLTLIHV